MLLHLRSSARAWCAAVCVACGSAEQSRDALGFDTEPASQAARDEPEPESHDFIEAGAGHVPESGNQACAVSSVVLREPRRPIDIILVLDNSVSMAGEVEAVERNINTHFARILEDSGADYRVIMISRHRTGDRTRLDDAKTAVCITEPLSTLADCPASAPGQNERFFQYSIDVDSHDSLALLLATYDQPDPLYRVTTTGWSAWLRDGARKVFLALTDDESFTEAGTFMSLLTERAPEHFGVSPSQPTFVFHSIVGLAEREPADAAYRPEEPLVLDRCINADRLASSAGRTYQTLSRLTGGLRYPLCHLDNYDAIFESIAADSIDRSGLGCRFPAPTPPAGKRLDLARLRLGISGGVDDTAVLAAVPGFDVCGPRGFYAEDEHIVLCPDFCSALLDEPEVTLSAVFDCTAFADVR
jgi:hypothetical protein